MSLTISAVPCGTLILNAWNRTKNPIRIRKKTPTPIRKGISIAMFIYISLFAAPVTASCGSYIVEFVFGYHAVGVFGRQIIQQHHPVAPLQAELLLGADAQDQPCSPVFQAGLPGAHTDLAAAYHCGLADQRTGAVAVD